MKISDIYQHYQILPDLAQHMLRVAAVAAVVCDHFQQPVDKTSIVAACLLHDMGNIIKFDLTEFPEFLEPQGLSYWEDVQADFKERFGNNELVATELIAEEIGVIERVKELIQAISFLKIEDNYQSDDYGKKIADYADTRVSPFGVVSLEQRLQDLEQRYGQKLDSLKEQQQRQLFFQLARKIEDQIFAQCDLSPAEVTNQAISATIITLKNFVVPVRS